MCDMKWTNAACRDSQYVGVFVAPDYSQLFVAVNENGVESM